MASFSDSIKTLLSDIQRFLTETLYAETLSANGRKEKENILNKIKSLKDEFPALLLEEEWSNDNDKVIQNTKDDTKDKDEVSEAEYEDTDFIQEPKRPPKKTTPDKKKQEPVKNIKVKETKESSPYSDAESPYSDKIPHLSVKEASENSLQGWLYKRRNMGKHIFAKMAGAQRRWCILKNNIFYYFEKDNDDEQNRGAIHLEDYKAVATMTNVKKNIFQFDMTSEQENEGKKKRTYQFYASSKEDRDKWISIINNQEPEILYEDIGPNAPIQPAKKANKAKKDSIVDGVYYEEAPIDPIEPEIYDDNVADANNKEQEEEFYDDNVLPSNVKSKPKQEVTEEIYDDNVIDDDDIYDECESPIKPVNQEPGSARSENQEVKSNLPPRQQDKSPSAKSSLGKKDNQSSLNKQLQDQLSKKLPVAQPGIEKTVDPVKKMPDTASKGAAPSLDQQALYVASWEFEAAESDELSFKEGDVLQVIDSKHTSWWLAQMNNETGFVPRSYISPIYEFTV